MIPGCWPGPGQSSPGWSPQVYPWLQTQKVNNHCHFLLSYEKNLSINRENYREATVATHIITNRQFAWPNGPPSPLPTLVDPGPILDKSDLDTSPTSLLRRKWIRVPFLNDLLRTSNFVSNIIQVLWVNFIPHSFWYTGNCFQMGDCNCIGTTQF